MAERRSTYLFEKEQDYLDAKDHLERTMPYDCNYTDKIECRGYWGSCSRFDWSECYRMQIWSECSDPIKAADIIREHRGRYYDE